MAAETWPEWLSGLWSGLWARPPPPPGSHKAFVEELRLSALVDKELRKPVGQRDEELVRKLRVERFTLGVENAQVGTAAATAAAAAELRLGGSGQVPCTQGSLVSSSVLSFCTCHPAHITCRPR